MCPCSNVGGEAQGKSHPHLPSVTSVPPGNVFGSSSSPHRLRTKRSLPSQRESVTSTFPVLEEAGAEEKEAFLALVGQMETGHSLSE